MFLDGDRFKQINDTHGHPVGDQLLISTAMRLSDILGEKHQLARLGGDEFTVFADNIISVDDMEALARTIIEKFKAPFVINNIKIYMNFSIGLVVADSSYKLASSILRDADIAMYKAKEAGKGNVKVFDLEMRSITMSLAELESDLHKAIEGKQFFLVYQPILDLKTDIITGFEALVRWQHPQKGIIPPYDFIPLAEETGLIWQVGEWVLDEACRQMKQWHELAIQPKPGISVNISTGQLRNAEFLSLVDEIVARHQIDPSNLKLELTESVLIENDETIRKLIDEFRSRNIDLAIDDFGTGYSSLAYLNEIPVQDIKIDKKFIDAIDCTPNGDVNQDALEIVKATISLGQSLRKLVTAEGIESEQQLSYVKQFGCDFAQGYFIAKPLSVEDAQELLAVPSNYHAKNPKHQRDDLLSAYKKALARRQHRLRDKILQPAQLVSPQRQGKD